MKKIIAYVIFSPVFILSAFGAISFVAVSSFLRLISMPFDWAEKELFK